MSYEPAGVYRCDGCGKTRGYLPDSWSEIRIESFERAVPEVIHHCLECRSIKKEWLPDGAVQ